ncbi:hypothetical protein EDC96DRAFT_98258 [Choanephora cucurbitarum]|nr:hypothetical protein EDC96DRAFT_98258 [Choanephora cucurbitarum]
MQAIGSEKLSLPLLLSPEGWKKTGRWDGAKGEFFRLKDRKESDMLLAPTHEEEITQLVAHDLRSFKQLPIRLYQIGRKYRDELRPRAGLLRGREFIMKDLYSFDASQSQAFETYDQVALAYQRIFQRLQVPFVVAEADSGNIGGSKSHEYHVISSVGEDTLLTCHACGYTANQELAVGQATSSSEEHPKTTLVSFSVPDLTETASYKGTAAILTPSDRAPNLLRVQSILTDYLKQHQQMSPRGTMEIIPIQQASEEPHHVFVDDSLETTSCSHAVHHTDHHIRLAQAGDGCRACQEGSLSSVKAIECGHTFYLGTTYSAVLGCQFKDQHQQMVTAEMGCYGIGISRLLAAIAEARYDTQGIAWPESVAPYRICIVPTDDRREEFKEIAHQIYDALSEVYPDDIVLDDRRSGFGAKMKDSELVGYPYTIIVGPNALKNEVEIHQRLHDQPSQKTVVDLDHLLFNKNLS